MVNSTNGDAFIGGPWPSNQKYAKEMASQFLKAKIPSIDFNIERGVSSGYMMVYGASRFDVGKQGARMINKVINGTKPGDIPVEFASSLTFEINAALAKSFGLTIPEKLLLQATKVHTE